MGTGPKLVIHVTHPRQLAIIGRGSLGTALARRLVDTGHQLVGPLARDYRAADLIGVELVMLCVPDREITAAASVLAERVPIGDRCPLVGHCSGASTLDALEPLPPAARFSLHPLMTFAGLGEPPWDGAGAAVAALGEPALNTARQLALALGLLPFEIEDRDRTVYHAAASIASNFLVTLELAAERLAGEAGVSREALLPLVRATVENWGQIGAEALTGPIARGDTATVARQREAIAERTPELLGLFDVLGQATRELALSTARATAAAPVPATTAAATLASTPVAA
jgi:predicted short-subunit dehydrogenase-like oxidoreductase (DUF2520 family)